MTFFTKLEQIILKSIWNRKRPRIIKVTLRKKNKVDSRLQTILHSCSHQNSMTLAENTWTNEAEQRVETNPPTCEQLTLPRKQEYTMEKRQSSASVVRKSDIKDVRTHPNTIYKINSKWLKDLNIRHDTIKLWEENIGKTFSDISHTNVFLSQSPEAIEIKAKMNKWDLIKLTSFYTSKETINKKTAKILRENISNDETYKGLISKIQK